MERIHEFSLASGESILVEVQPSDEGVVRAGRLQDAAGKAEQTFEAALDRIRPAANAIISTLKDLAESPDEVKAQFGIKLTAETGAILASASLNANYVVTLTWKKST